MLPLSFFLCCLGGSDGLPNAVDNCPTLAQALPVIRAGCMFSKSSGLHDSFSVKKLHKNGTYGGHECLVAFARVYDRLVFVHQPDERITFQVENSSRFLWQFEVILFQTNFAVASRS